jgi:hypothetical protein
LGSFAVLSRTRRGGVRLVVTLLAAASMLWTLVGPAVLSVDAAGPDDSAQAGQCGHESDRSHHHDRHCCQCCSRPIATPPLPPPAKKSPPPAAVRTTPPARSLTTGKPHPTAAPSPSATVALPTPIGSRLPLLAPPEIAVAHPVAPSVIATSPTSVYVVTLAALLVAGAIAAAAIVFVRRSD